tara:strand:- start:113 stop:394 length:282 start_codon:yes stop_codon:yes gene_type:complete
MFIAFTENLKYNIFACRETITEAKLFLVEMLVRGYTIDGVPPTWELDDDGYLQLFHDGYESGYIHTMVLLMEITPDGVGFGGYEPTMEGEWYT